MHKHPLMVISPEIKTLNRKQTRLSRTRKYKNRNNQTKNWAKEDNQSKQSQPIRFKQELGLRRGPTSIRSRFRSVSGVKSNDTGSAFPSRQMTALKSFTFHKLIQIYRFLMLQVIKFLALCNMQDNVTWKHFFFSCK